MDTIVTMRIASTASVRRARTGGSLSQTVLSVFAWIERLAERRRSRLALLEMTDVQLRDIGLSRADAYHEGKRQLWD